MQRGHFDVFYMRVLSNVETLSADTEFEIVNERFSKECVYVDCLGRSE